MTVNFDNAATTYPKPPEVRLAVQKALARCGSAGRGGHPLAAYTSDLVYRTRETAAAFFGTEPEHVVFTQNCTHALNLAIQGLARDGGHFITSSIEHNSVIRPLYALAKAGRIRYSIARVSPSPEETVRQFAALLRPDTRAVVCTLAGNVTGQILPWREIGALCRQHGICFVADGAQACGILPVKLSDGIDILCCAGHKGLYGITGTGMLLTNGRYPLPPLMQGGSGSLSNLPDMPGHLPDALECGTLGVIGIASLDAGIRFVQHRGMAHLRRHEEALCQKLIAYLNTVEGARVYRTPGADYVPLVSFNLPGIPSEEAAARLGVLGYCLRAGLHCAPLAHRHLGTPDGTVRFAPSAFSDAAGVTGLCHAIGQLVQKEKSGSAE
ncbi:MAG: aminotransferase class V-fold PLP-dependent enzyme [Oscillospiraceae bacterium]|nr:aminotransferase class V-fold PLP-dependent enzyme [Oscillospiraceae bacterium]